jgi:hypothetical protein
MNTFRTIIAALITIFTMNSCSSGTGNMAQMNQLKDSIFAAYPTVAAVTVNVQNDNNLLIAVGSEDLYRADAAQRQLIADEMASMALRIFGDKSKLEHGKMLVTRNEMNQDAEPTDALVSDMAFKK